ncbi:MAG: tRNA (guanosine(37)-N1)-methyltransferase TrmD [Anaerolineae bacterium]|nr:tRNA (guanosine(37)-N1)-methyltransferase TrmD [Anaerolineae bacterium]
MRIDILTLFPAMFFGPLQESLLKRAQQRGLLEIYLHQLRDYAWDRHQMTDDIPYGGGEGMVMKPEPVFRAVKAILGKDEGQVILLTPQGRTFDQQMAQELAPLSRVVFICGHYGGFDERIREGLQPLEMSIGDYVLTGGELAAMVIIDAVARWVPGVLGTQESAELDSHVGGLLEGPAYTRPVTYAGMTAPEVLRSGNHAAIARWRRDQALRRTWQRRPDLLEQATLDDKDRKTLAELGD